MQWWVTTSVWQHQKAFLELVWYRWVWKLDPRCTRYDSFWHWRRRWRLGSYRHHYGRDVQALIWAQVQFLLRVEMFWVCSVCYWLRVHIFMQGIGQRTCERPCVSQQMHQYVYFIWITFCTPSSCTSMLACSAIGIATWRFSFPKLSHKNDVQSLQEHFIHNCAFVSQMCIRQLPAHNFRWIIQIFK